MVVVLIPFAICSPLPLSDYPNHMARMHILANLQHSADLAKYYALDWGFVPNLAMDLVVPALIPLMSTESATMLFTAVGLFLMVSGTILLNRVLYGRYSLVPFAAFLLLYNRQFLWGFLNYLFSVGLALWIFTAHIYLRERVNAFARISLFSCLSVVLIVAHLHAFASYAILVGCYEISVAWRGYRNTGTFRPSSLLVPSLQFVIPIWMFFSLSSTAQRVGDTAYGGWMDKIVAFLDIFNNYSLILDAATFGFFGSLLIAGLCLKRVHIHPAMRLSIGLMLALYLAMPALMFSSYGADRRLLIMLSLVLLASLDVRLESTRLCTGLAVAVFLLFVTRMSVIGLEWQKAQRVYAPVLSAIDQIKPGSRLAVLVGGNVFPSLQNPPLDHLANMAVVKKNVYINSLFAEPGQQVLRLKFVASSDFSVSPSQTFRVKGNEIGIVNPFQKLPISQFDYLMIINPQYFVSDRPAEFRGVYQKDAVSLYRNMGRGIADNEK
jgi:hypothetical protein